MAGNSFGRILRLTTFGESHGAGLGGVLDGCPAGLELCEADLQRDLDLRRPGRGGASSPRRESDTVHILSGVFEGRTSGTPIAFYVANEDMRPRDYSAIAGIFRPGHADWGYFQKFGLRDYRGGGRSSGRETLARVAAGAIAEKILAREGIVCHAGCIELGGVAAPGPFDLAGASARDFFAASDGAPEHFACRVEEVRSQGETLGGLVRLVAANVPPGLGEPVFDKLEAVLAHAMMSVGAVRGVEVGAGFAAARLTGSRNNDRILPPSGSGGIRGRGATNGASFASNNAGGIAGGISTGQDIVLTVAVKPIPSIGREQVSLDESGRERAFRVGGRHDLAAIPRIVPVLLAMLRLVLADALLLQRREGDF